ncbi:hypothetical protein D9758_006924 [Tetrapyrgos nigripes]|uniref:Protein root UVB sensitive/RUS domain-containing protein n=1 Tax=Tetrapyrgos nigripes TaxID=182062 RepID=A0A8H5GSU6_9AGAR|nr:hypothetical protein D9758_006924 [Tetrapyrgos nigripes]
MEFVEKDETGRVNTTRIANHQISRISREESKKNSNQPPGTRRAVEVLSKVFLPVGYPRSVSPDYLSSLAGLLSSRATLEGYGVGNASASATNALLLSISQDMFGRLTTIIGAYYLGSSLFPEAKTYRFLADILNDAAIILDTISPMLALFFPFRLLSTSRLPFQIYTLCISASLRSLCGIAAGGSKTAITMHFATPLEGSGDVGDLNAKDSSKETVLGLLGMLLGTVVVPYLTTTWSTYTMLFLLVILHLLINYFCVRGVTLRTLNRQRASLAWAGFHRSSSDVKSAQVPSPSEIMRHERLFSPPDFIWSSRGSRAVGRCTIGSSIGSVFDKASASLLPPSRLLESFKHEPFVVWFDPRSLLSSRGPNNSESKSRPALHVKAFPHLHVFLKEGHASSDQLKAWLISCEVALLVAQLRNERNERGATGEEVELLFVQVEGRGARDTLNAVELILKAQATVEKFFPTFVENMLKAKWCADTSTQSQGSEGDGNEKRSSQPCLVAALMTRPPQGVIVDIIQDKKAQ